MSKLGTLALPVLFVASLLTAGASIAGPNDGNATWSFGGLYVQQYGVAINGDLTVVFENANGVQFTGWLNQAGVPQCPGQPMLRLSSGNPRTAELGKLLLGAGLAHKPLWVWFEATAGTCYVKQLTVSM
ncbi:MAG: hypothetical protein H7138_04835 [Myxococcales bacterium]|nr:hypothetical protein [Myxococcales bacterium]